MLAITENHKNICHGFTIEDSDIQQTMITTKFGSVFNLNMLFHHWWQPLPEITLVATMALPWKVRDLQWKPNFPKFGLVFNLNVLLAILDGSQYQKWQKCLQWLYH